MIDTIYISLLVLGAIMLIYLAYKLIIAASKLEEAVREYRKYVRNMGKD